jgi:hypothetical protein
MSYTANVPVTLATARLFTRYSGTVTIIAADIVSTNSTTGQYTYQPLSSTSFSVYSTHPNPVAGAVASNDAIDTGAVFTINLPLPGGSHSLIVITDSATIFRNNNVTGNPYPFSIPNVFSLTGNSATQSGNPNFYQGYYYYLYDMKIKTADCISNMATVVATTATAPTITLIGDSLISSTGNGNQWYFNGAQISGAINKSLKPTFSGNYSVTATDPVSGCQNASTNYSYVATAVNNVPSSTIGLTVSPNPNNALFTLTFSVNNNANLEIEAFDMWGNTVYRNNYGNFIGTFNKQLNLGNIADGIYILKIQHGNNVYRQKIMIKK